MKGKIEAAANIIVIVFAVVVGSVFLKDRLSPPAPEPEAVKAGDKLPNLDGLDWRVHEQTLVSKYGRRQRQPDHGAHQLCFCQ
jgi:hypothetical protein